MIRAASAALAVLILAACQPEPFGRTSNELRDERLACEADGGRFEPGGITGALTCFRDTPDGGAACSRSTDCSSACLADEEGEVGYCAAVTPLFGCFAVFDDKGRKEPAICVD